MTNVQIACWVGVAVLTIVGGTSFLKGYLKGRKEILNKDYSKEGQPTDLLKELYNMADNEGKEDIIKMVSNDIDNISNTLNSLPHETGKSAKLISPFFFYEELDTFNYKQVSKDIVYTAVKCSDDKYIVSWRDETGEYEKEYTVKEVRENLNSGLWIVDNETE